MEVYVVILRKKTQIFLDVKEDTPVLELKKMIGGILRVRPANMKLVYKSRTNELSNSKALRDYDIKATTTSLLDRAYIGLMLRDSNGNFEELEVTPMSKPGASKK